MAGLWDAPRLGRQRLWQEADLAYLEECLQQEPRTYNSKQLAEKLRRSRQVQLSPDRIRRVLKKRGGNGYANKSQPPEQAASSEQSH